MLILSIISKKYLTRLIKSKENPLFSIIKLLNHLRLKITHGNEHESDITRGKQSVLGTLGVLVLKQCINYLFHYPKFCFCLVVYLQYNS